MERIIRLFTINLLGIAVFVLSTGEIQAKEDEEQDTKNLSASIIVKQLDNSILLQAKPAENDEYPANELYEESWNTEFLKAYANAIVPDSFIINTSEFVMPVEGRLTSPFGYRGKEFHYGSDIKLEVGDTVRAAFSGKVRVENYERKGYGYYLVLRHFNGLETVYGHLSKFLVEPGQNVVAGQPVALGGNTGRSTGSHLHFEFRFLGNAINPAEIIDFKELALKDDIYVYVKNKPEKSHADEKDESPTYYKVKQGDTLWAIAKKHGTTVDDLCKINKLNPEAVLKNDIYVYVKDKSRKSHAEKKDVFSYHTVKQGDTLWTIAKKYSTTIDNLCKINKLNPDAILPIDIRIKVL